MPGSHACSRPVTTAAQARALLVALVHPRLQSPLVHSSPGFISVALQFWQSGRGTVSLPPVLHCHFRHHEQLGPPKPGAQTERERCDARVRGRGAKGSRGGHKKGVAGRRVAPCVAEAFSGLASREQASTRRRVAEV